jgi:cytochrome c
VWDAQTLSAFLESPMEYLPGTTMPFAGLRKPEQREALTCYLESIGDNP